MGIIYKVVKWCKIQLRDGTRYSCTGVVDFLQPVLDEYLADYPSINLLLRGDSGFATPELYRQCEENGTRYVIRLKKNNNLREKAAYLVAELDDITRENKVDYAVVYGEFMYQAATWPYERRVVCKVENQKKEDTLEETVKNALRQIKEKNYDAELIKRGVKEENIRYYGFAFRGKEVLIDGR